MAAEALQRAFALQGSVPEAQLAAWMWKREGRPDEEKYDRPYIHFISLSQPAAKKQRAKGRTQTAADTDDAELTLHQAKSSIGCTVWDGSIVMAKLLEHHQEGSSLIPAIRGSRCLELGSGSQALPGLVASVLGAKEVVVSDTGKDIVTLLNKNIKENASILQGSVRVVDYFWGKDTKPLGGPFDFIFVAEFGYIDEAMKPLVDCIRENNRSIDLFKSYADNFFDVQDVETDEWHPLYVDPECSVLILKKKEVEAEFQEGVRLKTRSRTSRLNGQS